MLAEYGCAVNACGFGDTPELSAEVEYFDCWRDALGGVSAVVLPLPCSTDHETVNMPLSAEKILIADLFQAMNKNQIILAGKVTEKVRQLALMYNIYIADYFEREELTVLNAVPTVEGAVQLAMEETPVTLRGSKCLVLGYGRIGKLLSKTLYALGADVTASARKLSDLAWIKIQGFTAAQTSEIAEVIPACDIIFNTIPCIVLDESALARVRPDALIIDLASKPGGVNFDAAARLGIKVIWALSLPGKVAPITAGRIITDTLVNLAEELGV
jgi:dipicolinate synthase subunit A